MIRLPSKGSYENLRRQDHRYDRIGVLDYNLKARRRNRGSAIFLHQCNDFSKGSAGCMALKEKDFKNLMKYLSKTSLFVVK